MKQSVLNKMLLKMDLCVSLIFICLIGTALFGISESKYKTSRILLNKCYGRFQFSTEFCILFQKKFGTDISPFGEDIDSRIDSRMDTRIDTRIDSRMDPRILSIYDECSSVNALHSNIVAEEVPDIYIDYIV